jgi:hypothetical protein
LGKECPGSCGVMRLSGNSANRLRAAFPAGEEILRVADDGFAPRAKPPDCGGIRTYRASNASEPPERSMVLAGIRL